MATLGPMFRYASRRVLTRRSTAFTSLTPVLINAGPRSPVAALAASIAGLATHLPNALGQPWSTRQCVSTLD